MKQTNDHDVKDLFLASKGKLRIEWAGHLMPFIRLRNTARRLMTLPRRYSLHAIKKITVSL